MAILYVNPAGSDSNPGTSASPLNNLRTAVDASAPGDTVRLMAGVHGARGTGPGTGQIYLPASLGGGTASSPIYVEADPAAGATPPQIIGQLYCSLPYIRFAGIDFNGPTGYVTDYDYAGLLGETSPVTINAEGVHLNHCIIRDGRSNAGVYITKLGATDIRINACNVYNNGPKDRPSRDNYSHGIYWDQGGGRITNCLIRDNQSWGIHMYQNPQGVKIANNTILDHAIRAGILWSVTTANCEAFNNIIANNAGAFDVYNLDGAGNSAHDNLLWGNTVANEYVDSLSSQSVANYANVTANPLLDTAYKPQAGSPAINTGLTTSLVTADFNDVVRPQGAGYDKGAFEIAVAAPGGSTPTAPALLNPVTYSTQLANGTLADAIQVMNNFANAKTSIDAVVARANLRPTVTGSRNGNVALDSLLDALVTLGLVVDSTT